MITATITIITTTTMHHGHDHSHGHGHVHDEHCGHSHGPTPDQLAGPGGWQRGLGTIFAVGMRPCSGAILVLVFSLAQGLFLGRHRRDLRDGARHRDHGRDHRRRSPYPPRASPAGSAPGARAAAR